MKISNRTIVAVIGCITIVSIVGLLQNANCLWALVLVIFLVDKIKD